MEFPPSMTICCTIPFDLLDFRGLLRPASFFSLAQQAAVLHSDNSPYSADVLRSRGVFFMLSRQRLFVSRPPRGDETLEISTWISRTSGAGWHREFSFRSGGEEVARIHSLWVTVDVVSRRIVPPSALGTSAASGAGQSPYRLRPLPPVPAEGDGLLRTVCYGDLDRNIHLNNVRAAEILCDAARLHHYPDCFVSEFQINFLAETRPDEVLSVYTQNDPFRATAYATGTPRFSGEFLLSPLSAL